MQIGRRIYEEFSTVVILKEQIRVSDGPWREFLDHLRHGRVEVRDLQILRTLLVQHRPSNQYTTVPRSSIDFSTAPWVDASLITPRHAVRNLWSEAAVRKLCAESRQQLLICMAQDTIKGKPLSLAQRYALASQHKTDGRRRRKDLPDSIHLALGMKVMVTNNLQTDPDITNGARRVVTDIILNPNKPELGEDHPQVFASVHSRQTFTHSCRTTARSGVRSHTYPACLRSNADKGWEGQNSNGYESPISHDRGLLLYGLPFARADDRTRDRRHCFSPHGQIDAIQSICGAFAESRSRLAQATEGL